MAVFVFSIKKDQDFVYRSLTNPDAFVSFHPLIYRMEKRADGRYKVFEKVQIGPIPYRFTYLASISGNGSEVKMEAVVMKFTRILMVFSVAGNDENTRVTEHVTLTSPLPIKAFMYALLQKQHAILFSNMAQAAPLP